MIDEIMAEINFIYSPQMSDIICSCRLQIAFRRTEPKLVQALNLLICTGMAI